MVGPIPLRIELENTSMPEGELVERLARVTSRHVYPGNEEATIHVVANDPRPIVLKGLLSDWETNVSGFADSMRTALRSLYLRARRIRMSYRNLMVEGVITRAEFRERREQEVKYEIEIEVAKYPLNTPPNVFDVQIKTVFVAAYRKKLDDLQLLYNTFVDEIAAPPPGSLVTEEDIEQYQTITPVELILDPWLEWRIQYEELQKRLRSILILAGNEDVLNIDDATQFGIRTGWILANRLRQGLDAWDGTGLGLLDQLTQIELLNQVASSLDALRLMLD
ncbi:hypothetical protein IT570_03475 [Candidatus Sumerlaeota bacterium]|nr:hypothetical protein [Candidatus Sumerlaeota bacterium]